MKSLTSLMIWTIMLLSCIQTITKASCEVDDMECQNYVHQQEFSGGISSNKILQAEYIMSTCRDFEIFVYEEMRCVDYRKYNEMYQGVE